MNVAIVFAGGSGQRMNSAAKPKQFLELYGKPIIVFTLEVFQHHPEIDQVIVPCIAGWEDYLQELLDKYRLTKVTKVLTGGRDTQESKMIALKHLATFCAPDDVVVIHDAVRPLITEKMISDNLEAVRLHGSAISVVPFSETGIVSSNGLTTRESIIRNTLYIAKAPQSFYFSDVYAAHAKGNDMDPTVTIDTCSLMTALGIELHLVPCETTNIKITTPEDFFVFKALIDLRESRDIFGM